MHSWISRAEPVVFVVVVVVVVVVPVSKTQ